MEKKKQGATPSNTSAVDDLEDTVEEDAAVFETAPPADRIHETLENTRTAVFFFITSLYLLQLSDATLHSIYYLLSLPPKSRKNQGAPLRPSQEETQ